MNYTNSAPDIPPQFWAQVADSNLTFCAKQAAKGLLSDNLKVAEAAMLVQATLLEAIRQIREVFEQIESNGGTE